MLRYWVSLTSTAKVYTPEADGTPESMPVMALKAKPGGSEPLTMDQS